MIVARRLKGCCTAIWKASGKTTTLLLFLFPDRFSKNRQKSETLPLVTKRTLRYSQEFAHFFWKQWLHYHLSTRVHIWFLV